MDGFKHPPYTFSGVVERYEADQNFDNENLEWANSQIEAMKAEMSKSPCWDCDWKNKTWHAGRNCNCRDNCQRIADHRKEG